VVNSIPIINDLPGLQGITNDGKTVLGVFIRPYGGPNGLLNAGIDFSDNSKQLVYFNNTYYIRKEIDVNIGSSSSIITFDSSFSSYFDFNEKASASLQGSGLFGLFGFTASFNEEIQTQFLANLQIHILILRVGYFNSKIQHGEVTISKNCEDLAKKTLLVNELDPLNWLSGTPISNYYKDCGGMALS